MLIGWHALMSLRMSGQVGTRGPIDSSNLVGRGAKSVVASNLHHPHSYNGRCEQEGRLGPHLYATFTKGLVSHHSRDDSCDQCRRLLNLIKDRTTVVRSPICHGAIGCSQPTLAMHAAVIARAEVAALQNTPTWASGASASLRLSNLLAARRVRHEEAWATYVRARYSTAIHM